MKNETPNPPGGAASRCSALLGVIALSRRAGKYMLGDSAALFCLGWDAISCILVSGIASHIPLLSVATQYRLACTTRKKIRPWTCAYTIRDGEDSQNHPETGGGEPFGDANASEIHR